MSILKKLYGSSLSLLTDFYELTMSYGYWKTGVYEKEAVFNLFFRENPFGGGYAVACGLETVMDYLNDFRFDSGDIEYLSKLKGADGSPLFENDFLEYLENLEFTCDVDAIPEGTPVFPFETVLQVTGPIIQGQILESALLNILNFQTLVASKAARVCLAAGDDPVLEFGLRRAQGIDGGISASRASYIGGCAGTSNVLAGKLYGIPVKGTHAHSWVMSFDNELESFMAYAAALPDNCIFLVDTYDTLEGVRNAVIAGKWLRSRGHEMLGIRIDSGDLSSLSIEARKILDEAGFKKAFIVGSGDLDEYSVAELKKKNSAISSWGIGTRMVTGHKQSALGGVYKLAAVRAPGEEWEYRVKLSEEKTNIPGITRIRRYFWDEGYLFDVIYDYRVGCSNEFVTMNSETKHEVILGGTEKSTELLIPVFRGGKQVYKSPSINELRNRTIEELGKLKPDIIKLENPEQYPVYLEKKLDVIHKNLFLKKDGE